MVVVVVVVVVLLIVYCNNYAIVSSINALSNLCYFSFSFIRESFFGVISFFGFPRSVSSACFFFLFSFSLCLCLCLCIGFLCALFFTAFKSSTILLLFTIYNYFFLSLFFFPNSFFSFVSRYFYLL